jgi:hypothetical protein
VVVRVGIGLRGLLSCVPERSWLFVAVQDVHPVKS